MKEGVDVLLLAQGGCPPRARAKVQSRRRGSLSGLSDWRVGFRRTKGDGGTVPGDGRPSCSGWVTAMYPEAEDRFAVLGLAGD
jgi:hypothetical protein